MKFTESGRIDVEVSCLEEGDQTAVAIKVTDTGVGIDPSQIERVFGRFEQADGSISRRFGGTGLGLAISQSLAAQMGGKITVTSEPGQGSAFSVHMHLPRGAQEDLDLAEGSEALPDLGMADLKVLIVEDVDVNQELIRLLLERFCARIDCVEDGQAALDLAAASDADYDLVLMDVQMPVMDGLEASRLIRALGGDWARIPILALTANVLPDQIARCRAAGMQDHIGKPFESDVLISAVAKWARIARAGLTQPVAAGPAPRTPAPPRPGIDGQKLERLKDQIGGAALNTLLRALVGQLNMIGGGGLLERDKLRARAHSVLGAAGMLGFEDVEQACRRLEQACVCDGALEPALKQAIRACRHANGEIEQLLAASATFETTPDQQLHEALTRRMTTH